MTDKPISRYPVPALPELPEDIRGRILAALAPAGRTLEELVAQRFMYPPGYQDVFVDDAERKCLREHLAELLADGRASLEDGRYRAVGRSAG